MKPINIKNILSIGLLLSIIPAYSMLSEQDLTEHLLTDGKGTELQEMHDSVVINVDGTSSNESSPAKSTDGLMNGEKKGYFARMKNVFNNLPRGAKDAIEISGVTAFTIGSAFYGQVSGDQYLPILIAYAAGRTSADITQRFKYYKKIIPSFVSWGILAPLYFLVPEWGFLINAFCYQLIMYMVHTTFEDYAIKTGRRNNFTEDFKNLPKDLQEQLIDGVKNVVTELKNADIEMAVISDGSSNEDNV